MAPAKTCFEDSIVLFDKIGATNYNYIVDTVSREKRSEIMGKVRGQHTAPERLVRRLVRGLGIRFSLYSKKLPGHPDLVFPSRKKVIFVHGCFWHQHRGCVRAKLPSSHNEYWVTKLHANQLRDRRNVRHLTRLGWRTLTLWECKLKEITKIQVTILAFLESANSNKSGLAV